MRAKMYAHRKIDKKLEDKRCKGKTFLLLMTVKPASLTVKQFTERKCCLKIRNKKGA